MVELANHYPDNQIQLKEIAENQAISEKYLSKLVIPLKGFGLIIAFRGFQGGYQLAKSPSAVTVLEIVEALEGPLALVDCVSQPKQCQRNEFCPTRSVWCQVNQAIRGTLAGITLEDLALAHQHPILNYAI